MKTQLGSIVDRPVLEASEPHVALALVLDVSGSMSGEKMDSLNDSVNQMINQLKQDERLSKIVDLGIFTFGEKDKACVHQGFRAISDCENICLEANDSSTYVADTLNMAIDRLRDRRHLYEKSAGAYKPWLILITDGEFHDTQNELEQVAGKLKLQESSGKIRFFGIGTEGFNRSQLECLTNNSKYVIEFTKESFKTRSKEFFSWVGRSMPVISSKSVIEEKEGNGTLPPLVFSL